MRGRVFILLVIFMSTEHINMLYKHCLCVHVHVCLCEKRKLFVCAYVKSVSFSCVHTRISQVKSVSFSLFLFLTNNYGFCEKVEQIANFHCFFAIFLRFFCFFFVWSLDRV